MRNIGGYDCQSPEQDVPDMLQGEWDREFVALDYKTSQYMHPVSLATISY